MGEQKQSPNDQQTQSNSNKRRKREYECAEDEISPSPKKKRRISQTANDVFVVLKGKTEFGGGVGVGKYKDSRETFDSEIIGVYKKKEEANECARIEAEELGLDQLEDDPVYYQGDWVGGFEAEKLWIERRSLN